MLRGRAHPLPDWSAWLAHCKSLQAAYPPGTTNSAPDGYVDMYDLIRAVSANAEPGDVIVTDMGYSFQSVYQCWEVKQGQRLLTNTGLAPMGWGLPAAVGAAIGTGRRVICITGDGGIMMNLQELATIAHQNLNVKIVLVNNGGYLTMRKSQEHAFGAHMGSDESGGLGMPDFDQTARSFGLNSRTLLHGCTNAITHFLSWLLGIDGPALLEVYTDPNGETVPKSVNRRLDDGTIQQTAIEDSWPYLSQEEINLRMEICNG